MGGTILQVVIGWPSSGTFNFPVNWGHFLQLSARRASLTVEDIKSAVFGKITKEIIYWLSSGGEKVDKMG